MLSLMIRTEAVALATPSIASGPPPELRALAAESTRHDRFKDSLAYWSTKRSSGSGPSPPTNTGSCWDKTRTARKLPSGFRATSRFGGVPEKPGTGARSTDSNTYATSTSLVMSCLKIGQRGGFSSRSPTMKGGGKICSKAARSRVPAEAVVTRAAIPRSRTMPRRM